MAVPHISFAAALRNLARSTGSEADTAGLLTQLSEWLREANVAVDRTQIAVRTLHPQVIGRAFTWTPEGGIVKIVLVHGELESERFRVSPLYAAFQGGPVEHCPIAPAPPHRYPILTDLQAQGFTDYLVVPLTLDGPPRAVATFATKALAGFPPDAVRLISELAVPLGMAVEIHEARRTASGLLETYLGRHTGQEVLAGRVRLGDTVRIHAALWSCDLRGFTTLSSERPGDEVIRYLNQYFGAVAAAIDAEHGEILKFIGDAVLAIFPVDDTSPSAACARALSAATALLAHFGAEGPRIGVALHIGEVLYGNIGAPNRLDFTVIGPAVNLLSRIEGQCATLGEPLLVSDAFANTLGAPLREVGAVRLKGIAEAQRLFAPPTRTTP